MMVDILLAVGIIGVALYCMALRGALYRALGLRDDWKRRFDQLKKVWGKPTGPTTPMGGRSTGSGLTG